MAGRKRIELGPKGEAIIAAALRSGLSSKRLQEDLSAAGIEIGIRTLKARLAEKRGRVRATRSDRGKPKAKSENGEGKAPLQGRIPNPKPLEINAEALSTLDEFVAAIASARAGLARASQEGNLAEVSRLARTIAVLKDAQRKAKPDEVPDPDDDPDLRVLAQKTAVELHKMVDQIVGAKP